MFNNHVTQIGNTRTVGATLGGEHKRQLKPTPWRHLDSKGDFAVN
jgi:hypothetical protein